MARKIITIPTTPKFPNTIRTAPTPHHTLDFTRAMRVTSKVSPAQAFNDDKLPPPTRDVGYSNSNGRHASRMSVTMDLIEEAKIARINLSKATGKRRDARCRCAGKCMCHIPRS